MNAGDVVLVRTPDLFGWIIRLGEALRLRRSYAFWNHAAIAVSDRAIVEATGRGVRYGRPDEYEARGYAVRVVRSGMGPGGTLAAVEFARGQVGDAYGWAQIAADAISCLTGRRLRWRAPRTYICSELVADALARGGVRIPSRASFVMPADIAAFYRVLAS